MDKDKKPDFVVSGNFIVWFVVAIVSLMTATFAFAQAATGYSYNSGGMYTSSLIFLLLSLAFFYALFKKDARLLEWTALVEFIILLLPVAFLNADHEALPYSLWSGVFVLSLPALWTLIPIGIMGMMQKRESRVRLLQVLFALTILTAVSWTLIGAHPLLISVLFLPFAMWVYWLRRLDREAMALSQETGVMGLLLKNAPEILLVAILVCVLAFGWAIKPAPYSLSCGNGMCEAAEDQWSCPWDCGYCGDGFCDSYAGEDAVSCSPDCTVCGDGVCDLSEDGYCGIDCWPTAKTIKVQVAGGIYCDSLQVVLKDSSGLILESSDLSYSRRTVSFKDITAATVYAEVSASGNPENPHRSNYIDTSESTTIRVWLPEDYCLPVYGSVTVIVTDSVTGSPLDGAFVSAIRDSDGLAEDMQQTVNGVCTLTLRPDERYYITVSAPGFLDNTFSQAIYMFAGEYKSATVVLDPIQPDAPIGGY